MPSIPHATDLDLAAAQISGLTSADAVAGFLSTLGYDTSSRTTLTPESIGLHGDAATSSLAVPCPDLLAERVPTVVLSPAFFGTLLQ